MKIGKSHGMSESEMMQGHKKCGDCSVKKGGKAAGGKYLPGKTPKLPKAGKKLGK